MIVLLTVPFAGYSGECTEDEGKDVSRFSTLATGRCIIAVLALSVVINPARRPRPRLPGACPAPGCMANGLRRKQASKIEHTQLQYRLTGIEISLWPPAGPGRATDPRPANFPRYFLPAVRRAAAFTESTRH